MKPFILALATFCCFTLPASAAEWSAPTFNSDLPAELSSKSLSAQPRTITVREQMLMQSRSEKRPLLYNGDEDRAANKKKRGKKNKKANSFTEKPREPKSATGNYQE